MSACGAGRLARPPRHAPDPPLTQLPPRHVPAPPPAQLPRRRARVSDRVMRSPSFGQYLALKMAATMKMTRPSSPPFKPNTPT